MVNFEKVNFREWWSRSPTIFKYFELGRPISRRPWKPRLTDNLLIFYSDLLLDMSPAYLSKVSSGRKGYQPEKNWEKYRRRKSHNYYLGNENCLNYA